MTTEQQQDAIIGKLTREVESLKDTLQRNNEARDKRKRDLGYSSSESFDAVWDDVMCAYSFAWSYFVSFAADNKGMDKYNTDWLKKEFGDMFRANDWDNMEKYLENAEMPF